MLAISDEGHAAAGARGRITALAAACARLGDWSRAIGLLEHLDPGDRVDTLVTCLHETDPTTEMVARIVDLADGTTPPQLAQVAAAAASALAWDDRKSARDHAAVAVGLSLGELPEGDTDELRRLLALALHEDGGHQAAIDVASKMTWPMNGVAVLSRIIETATAASPQVLEGYAEAIIAVVEAAQGETLLEETLQAAARAAWFLASSCPATTQRLCACISQAPRRSVIPSQMLRTLALTAAAQTRLDEAAGLAAHAEAVRMAQEWSDLGQVEIGVRELTALIDGYAAVSDYAPQAARQAFEAARALAAGVAPGDRIGVECAYAAAIAPVDPRLATAILRTQLGEVRPLAAVPPMALRIVRMLAEFTARLAGARHVQTEAVATIVRAVVRAAPALNGEAGGLLDAALGRSCRSTAPPIPPRRWRR